MSGFNIGDPIAAGTTIGILGATGSAAAGGSGYGPHLHFELRVGTRASLQSQLKNPSTTQWGFDPHMNPMLLFTPYAVGSPDYSPSLTTLAGFTPGQNAQFRFASGNSEQPLLNRWDVRIVNTATGQTVASHVLDYDLRTGFDASSTANLDSRDLTKPFVEPQPFGDTSGDFVADLVVPSGWLAGYTPGTYRLEVDATDIWGHTVSAVAVPEPSVVTLALLAFTTGILVSRLRSRQA